MCYCGFAISRAFFLEEIKKSLDELDWVFRRSCFIGHLKLHRLCSAFTEKDNEIIISQEFLQALLWFGGSSTLEIWLCSAFTEKDNEIIISQELTIHQIIVTLVKTSAWPKIMTSVLFVVKTPSMHD